MTEKEQCCAAETYRGRLHVVRTCESTALEFARGLREEGIILGADGYAEVWECDGYGCTRDIYRLNKRDSMKLRKMMERTSTYRDFRRVVRFVVNRGELVDFE